MAEQNDNAPNTDVTVTNNGEVFGAIVGKTLTIPNNVKIHFDEQLNTVTATGTQSSSGKTSITSWQECKNSTCQ